MGQHAFCSPRKACAARWRERGRGGIIRRGVRALRNVYHWLSSFPASLSDKSGKNEKPCSALHKGRQRTQGPPHETLFPACFPAHVEKPSARVWALPAKSPSHCTPPLSSSGFPGNAAMDLSWIDVTDMRVVGGILVVLAAVYLILDAYVSRTRDGELAAVPALSSPGCASSPCARRPTAWDISPVPVFPSQAGSASGSSSGEPCDGNQRAARDARLCCHHPATTSRAEPQPRAATATMGSKQHFILVL